MLANSSQYEEVKLGPDRDHAYRQRKLGLPCPGLAALFNHSYLHAKDIDEQIAFWKWGTALVECYNFTTVFAMLFSLFSALWLKRRPTLHFSIRDLGVHGRIEHDASMTRYDASQGDALNPDPTLIERLFDQLAYYRAQRLGRQPQEPELSIVTLDDFARHKLDLQKQIRQYAAQSKPVVAFLGAGEVAFALQAHLLPKSSSHAEHHDEISANSRWLRVWFEEERLPVELGWKKPMQSYTLFGTLTLIAKIFMVQYAHRNDKSKLK
ncbi:hypothetical protein O181_064576 [Austropuccinia psidii MF-1]|uniref:Heme haloperoxidase family profile domain-containing protein n=1 Tax=Austropuccinia psidii MF-1 TaxID=1389203 RepID=A0A9Q3I0E6_9BASI|nr:hypothetical protein [Austropuccinia psidii MF-1]